MLHGRLRELRANVRSRTKGSSELVRREHRGTFAVLGDLVSGVGILRRLQENGYRVVVFTVRWYEWVERWVEENGIRQYVDEVTNHKCPAQVYLDDRAVWMIDVPKPGKYAVEFDWSCDASVAAARNPWMLDFAGGNIGGRVASTGNWDTYRQSKVGEFTLPAGQQRIVLRPAVKPQGALLDLKAIRLVPVK